MASRVRWVVTGGIAMGKSTVLARFGEHGRTVLSADEVVRELWEDKQIGSAWAKDLGVTFPIDRDELRGRLQEHGFRQKIAEVIQPQVLRRLLESPAEIVEIPVLFEACVQAHFQRIVVVTCSYEEQRARLTKRLGSQIAAYELIASQLPSIVKEAFADFTVYTTGSLEDTLKQVDLVVAAN